MTDSPKRGAHFNTSGDAEDLGFATEKTVMMPHAVDLHRNNKPQVSRPGAVTPEPAREWERNDARSLDELPDGHHNTVVVVIAALAAIVVVAFAVMFFAKLGPFAGPADGAKEELAKVKSKTSEDSDGAEDGANIQTPTVEGDATGDSGDSGQSGDAQAVTPGGGTGADNEVDASKLFGDGDSGKGDTSSPGSKGDGSSNSKDPADNDVSMPDNGGNGDNGGNNGAGGNNGDSGTGNGGVVTEPDGSQWTGYY